MTTYGVVPVGELLGSGRTRFQIDRMPRVAGFDGVRLAAAEPPDPRLVRIGAAVEVAPPGAVLSGWAAAALHGVPPTFLDGTVDGRRLREVDVSVPRDCTYHARQGLRIHRSTVGTAHRTEIDGLTVTTPPRTAMDLARWCRSDRRRLAMLDLAVRFGLITVPDFVAFIDPLAGLHGLNALRPLVPLASGLAESTPESEFRFDWIGAGLPRPEPNAEIFDLRGVLVGRADLLAPGIGLVGEYQGYPHLIDGAPEADQARIARFERMNLTVVTIWKSDVAAGCVADKLLEGRRRAEARDTRLDAWVWRPGTPPSHRREPE